jgi:HAD superfamily hydrolase (TIGR01509 family)
MALKAVLFDMDGTLVDSIPAWHKTFNQVLALQGSGPVTYEFFVSDILGESTEADIKRFFPTLTSGELVGFYNRHFPPNLFSVRAFPQTPAVLDLLTAAGIRKGIVTNTPRGLMIATLNTVGLEGRFDSLVGGDDVPEAKPAPDMILESCRRLDVMPSEALLVGDTKSDTQAGANAKVRTVGIGVSGDWRISSLEELAPLLVRLMGDFDG